MLVARRRGLLVVVGAFLLHPQCYAQTETRSTNANVTLRETQSCQNIVPSARLKYGQGDVQSVKREGDEFVVSVVAWSPCIGVTAQSPTVQISSGTVALSWVWFHRPEEPYSPCVCARQLEFRVSGVPLEHFVVIAETADARARILDARLMYQRGVESEKRGQAKDAIRLYRTAGRSGSAEAARRLGQIYEQGALGLAPDKEAAHYWFQKAEKLGAEQPPRQ